MAKAVKEDIAICWLRRDLRLFDNTALYHALKSGLPVQLIFIFDPEILNTLPDKDDKRVAFIHRELENINTRLNEFGASVMVLHDLPKRAFEKLIFEHSVRQVFSNQDYEPYARKRDKEVRDLLTANEIEFHSYKDQVIFEKAEVMKTDGTPYTVFTPYSKKWKEKLQRQSVPEFPSENLLSNLLKKVNVPIIPLREIGFEAIEPEITEADISEELIENYHNSRDLPFLEGTSRVGIHLRFGTMSIRHLVKQALRQNEVWFNELIWREFFMMILYHFPHVEHQNFRRKYDRIEWRNNEKEFELWCRGETGYPMVDAGMRQLNETGWMHNRVRMVVAGFLCKHLLVDWRWGEAYFAQKLLDYELASNNGNWQWAAGTGCDSAPYFRVFNPISQLEKFDPKGIYVRTWVKDLDELTYPQPIVDHKFGRERAISTYKLALADS